MCDYLSFKFKKFLFESPLVRGKSILDNNINHIMKSHLII